MVRTDRSLRQAIAEEVRAPDLALLAVVPVVLAGVFQFPGATRTGLAFDVSAPTVLTAYSSHYVHLSLSHLLGNLLVYLVVAPLTYLLLAISGRQQLFRWSSFTFLVAFPFTLSLLQLVFPRARLLLGFSGLNAAFFGLLCFAVVAHAGTTLSGDIGERDAPVLLFSTVAVIALVSLPSRAWSTEIAAVSAAFGLLYLAAPVYRSGLPSREAIDEAIANPGYFELTGGGLGVVFAYPFVGFQDAVIPGGGVVDVYAHLLGFCLAFIVVYSFVFVVDRGGAGGGDQFGATDTTGLFRSQRR
jgi:hypothetical protein